MRLLILSVSLDENKQLFLTSALNTLVINGGMHLVKDGFLSHKSDTYLHLPLLRPSLERVWHPLSLILYRETMGSGGEELLCEQEGEW